MDLRDWLLGDDADPAIRWQVMRDLDDAPADAVAAERAKVSTEGWGARLLALQADDGLWDGGVYDPSWLTEAYYDDHDGQPWTGTLHVLKLLWDFGADPASPPMRQAIDRVRPLRWDDGGAPFFEGEVEECINGVVVAIGSAWGEDVDLVVDRLLADQQDDGGWNCDRRRGAKRSSFHSTISVLEGLLEHERATGGTAATREARRRAEEHLLERGLMRRLSTGEIIDPTFLELSFPTRWFFDVLRGLDYLRSTGAGPDRRLADALQLIRDKRSPDGTWQLEHTHPGEVPFDLEAGDGAPSRWNTLRALRVLSWAGDDVTL